MNTVSRGIRNAFRNSIRTTSIVIILGLSIGLSLTMLIARQAVTQKISSVKSSIGNTITIAPAGFSSFSSANNALTTSQLSPLASLPHVTNITETLTDRLTTIGSSQPSFGGFGGQSSDSTSDNQTSLSSPIKINVDANRSGSGQGFHVFINGGASLPANFSLPISIIGTNNPGSIDGTTLNITSGKAISGTTTADDAVISSGMASKNNLKVGSTFTAYGTTLTVAGIFTTTNQALGGEVIVSLPVEQTLSGQSSDVTSAIATVDSLDNLSSATAAIKNKLGSNADVTSSIDQANQTVAPLNSVKSVALFSLIGAVIAGGVIILLIMIMIVRERRREIGVLKAIGGSNVTVMSQFMIEAVTFTILGALVGLIIGVAGGQPVTKLLVNNTSTNSATTIQAAGFGGRVGGPTAGGATHGGGFARQFSASGAVGSSIKNIHAAIGWSVLFYGLGAAIIIALIGSAAASILIARVRPAEVMRAE